METGIEVAKQAWGINPGTVYGFLVVILIMGLVVFAYVIRILHKEKKDDRTEYMGSVKEHTKSIDAFTESIKDMNKSLVEHRTATDRFMDIVKDKL